MRWGWLSTALVAVMAVAAGCGGAEPPPAKAALIEVPTVAPPAAARMVAVAPADEGWAPFGEEIELHGTVWTGEYLCGQGLSDMTVTIERADGPRFTALVEFAHKPTKVEGAIRVSGSFDPASRRVVIVPGDWVRRPPGYEPVGFDGEILPDGNTFRGQIVHEACGGFALRRVPPIKR